ncbi:hypothetical protein THRCLA_22790 [Thraustotheca clavata]|uniref:Transmembrane protein n=1 Tax=Thraustotheca clavata TaxID=74557 RepID=A0A1V9YSW3_9STRA|nr:hypothetical protein THRCLA_22790 [Thraustotheca clavata]
MSGLHSLTTVDYASICKYDPTNIHVCFRYLQQVIYFLVPYEPQLNTTSITASINEANQRLESMNIQFMIYTKQNATAALELLTIIIFDPSDPGFKFFAWTYLIDWIFGYREVISFRGDNGNLTLLTDYQLPLAQQVVPSEITTNLVRYSRAGIIYIAFMMLALSFVLVGYMIVTKGEFEGYNMFQLDQVGGIVWVGRPSSNCLLAKWYVGPKPTSPVRSLLLSHGARYHFTHTSRITKGVYYLDRASAALNDIITFRYGAYMYAFDIKLWRMFSSPQLRYIGDEADFIDRKINASYPLTK